MHTAMCVVGKNYRLQDIQLSKNYDLLSWLPVHLRRLAATVDNLRGGLPTEALAPYLASESEGWRIPGSNR